MLTTMRGLDGLNREKVALPPCCYVAFSSGSGRFSRASGALGLAVCCTAVTLLLERNCIHSSVPLDLLLLGTATLPSLEH